MRALVSGLALLTLSACGGGSSNNEMAGRSPEEIEAMMGQGSGGPVSGSDADQREAPRTASELGIDCNAANAQQPQGMDMIGVTVGMPADQALAQIACSNPALRVEFSTGGGYPVPPPPNGGQMRTSIIARSDNEQITATLVGMPGQERVVTIMRHVRYGAGEETTIDAYLQQLERKYGRLMQDYGTGARNMAVSASFAPGGQTPMQDPSCAPRAPGTTISAACGPAIRVVISRSPNNEHLVGEIEAVMNDGATGMRLIEEYTALAGPAQQQRQQQELNQAAERRPTL